MFYNQIIIFIKIITKFADLTRFAWKLVLCLYGGFDTSLEIWLLHGGLHRPQILGYDTVAIGLSYGTGG